MGDLIALVYAALWIVAANTDKPSFTTTVHEVAGGFSSAIASWNVSTSGDAWIGVQMRARVGERWTRWYDMGHWSSALDDGHRHSIAKQSDADASVDTDTLNLVHPASAVQVRAELHPSAAGSMPQLHLLSVTTDNGSEAAQAEATAAWPDIHAWGTDMDVPQLTQSVGEQAGAYGGGGGSWCSPTSVAMVMGYWARKLDKPQWVVDVPTAAKGTYDPVYDGCGNWPFNVAYASEHGLAGYIERFSTLAEVERLVARGIPVIASIKVAPGELDGTPYKSTDGHLLVVRGFTADGDVIVNEPDGAPGTIRRVYKRAQFAHVWQHGSHGAVYIIAPPQDLPKQPS